MLRTADDGALQSLAAHSEQEIGRKRGKTESGPSLALGEAWQEAYRGSDTANRRRGMRRRKLGFVARRAWGEAVIGARGYGSGSGWLFKRSAGVKATPRRRMGQRRTQRRRSPAWLRELGEGPNMRAQHVSDRERFSIFLFSFLF